MATRITIDEDLLVGDTAIGARCRPTITITTVGTERTLVCTHPRTAGGM